MDSAAVTPQAIVTVGYTFAALFALSASVMWFRLVDARQKRAHEGGPITLRWLTEAATATGLALGLAAITFLFSLL